jgi:modulator of FtsH protease
VHTAYEVEEWHDFALAAAGAAAALAGLLVVAVSINIREIVASQSLTRRAGVALTSLTAPLVIALIVLIPVGTPSDSAGVLGSLVLVTGIVTGLALGPLVLRPQLSSQRTMAQWALGEFAPAVLLVVAACVAGLGLATGALGGLYWLPVAVIAGILGGLAQAWVLLIEILR